MERVLVLRPVVPAACQAPRPPGGGLELGEVQLPHLIRTGRVIRERRLASLGKLAAFPLVVRGQDQPLDRQANEAIAWNRPKEVHMGLASPLTSRSSRRIVASATK